MKVTSPINNVLFQNIPAIFLFFHLYFVSHIYEVVHLPALRFNIKLAISFHAVVYYYSKVHPKAERNKASNVFIYNNETRFKGFVT